jgi:hypothetical protein
MNDHRDCGCCESYRPCPVFPPPPVDKCCSKSYEGKIYCHRCKHSCKFCISIPSSKSVYLNARLPGPVTLTPATVTPLLFNTVVSVSEPCIFSILTGLLTVPPCGQGIYTITTNMTLSAPVTPSIFVLTINVSGLPIDTRTYNIAAGDTQDVSLPVAAYPVQVGQTIGVSISGSTGGTVSNAYFSLVRSSEL